MGAVAPPCSNLSVKLEEPIFVPPAEPTKNHDYFLSNLDQNVAVWVETVYLFEAKLHDMKENCPLEERPDPVVVIRQALAKVLVQYYPLAGKLGISEERKLIVHCNGKGVLFVEGFADARISDLGDTTKPYLPTLGQLVYQCPGTKSMFDIPLVTVQVTKFQCGGFALGLRINHCLIDGVGAMEFINSWAETARGLPLSIPPAIDRTILKARSPTQINYPHLEFLEMELISDQKSVVMGDDLVYKAFRFSGASLERLRETAGVNGTSSKCTTFEALAALVWRARTQAMGMDHNQKAKLLFAVDGRSRFDPQLPKGYMGNGVVMAAAATTAGELVESPLSQAVKRVQEAKKLINDDYMRSAIDYFEATRACPSLAATLLITTWSRLSFFTTDFGWGEPIFSGPVSVPEREVAVFLSRSEDMKSITVLLGLPSIAMDTFEHLLQPHLLL